MGVTIAFLADEAGHLPVLAEWLHAEWGALRPGSTVASRVERLESHLQRRAVPCAFVAVENGRPLGTASLVEHDMTTRQEWSPWLAGVFVHPEHRGRGVASALVERVAAEAVEVGARELYLYTRGSEALYARLGWRLVTEEPYRGQTVTTMVRPLATRESDEPCEATPSW